MAKYYAKIVIVLFNVILSLCDESAEDLAAKEYIKTFSTSIPMLLEYLLDKLENKPEILEDNTITAFVNDNQMTRNRRSSQVNNHNNYNGDEQNKDLKQTATESKDAEKYINGNLPIATKRHEYGNIIPNSITTTSGTIKRDVNLQKQEEFKNNNLKIIKTNKIRRMLDKKDFGVKYPGSADWTLTLSSQEVEDLTLQVEKELEEHNTHKD